MNCRTQVIAAAGIGYFLGRQHKLRWGLLLAAAAAAGRISGPGDILQRGVKALTSAPDMGGLAGLGAPLVAAGKEAARAAVTGQIDSVTGKLRDRAEGLRRPGGGRQEPDEQPDEDDGRGRRSPATRRDDKRPDDGRPQERPRRRPRAAREEREEQYEEEPPAQRRRPAAERDDVEPDDLERDDLDPDAAADDEADDEEYDEPEEEPAELSGVGRSRPDAGSRSPVHRRGR
ncbi:hypothetical protein OHA72_33640 [Dactylosporangium sp. NBC_01737]|uniref:hypothetical protein n=1 Tax=Dactylosporangium sp. NBC_01737 TaxID=2975959 RepID=UPI002E0FF23D|nr:hypothetical protein OHA72_33640 [Dactylosporangium sp. NBC_01737]